MTGHLSSTGAWLLAASQRAGPRTGLDVGMLALAGAAASSSAAHAGVSTASVGLLVCFGFLTLGASRVLGAYRRRFSDSVLDGLGPLLGAVSLAAMVSIAASVLLTDAATPTPLIARAWLFAFGCLALGRVVLALLARGAGRAGALRTPTLIVGAGAVGTQIARRLDEHPEYGLRTVGFLDADPAPQRPGEQRPAQVLGAPGELVAVAARTGARHVIFAFSSAPDSELIPLVRQCDRLGLQTWIVPRFFDTINEHVALDHLGGLPLHGLRPTNPRGARFTAKHACDRMVAALGLLVLAPLLGAIALAVRLSSPGPVLFRQLRVGRDGRTFELLKFRSMRIDPTTTRYTPDAGLAPGGVEGADRRTALGRCLRRSCLDELPQLVNVLRAEMSLVGPRPERPDYVDLFRDDIDRYGERHRVRAGMTGWAQVHGQRGQSPILERVESDNWYIENWTPLLDLKILLLTAPAVLRSAR